MREDFGEDPPCSFEELCRHPIVGAFQNKLSASTKGSKTIGPDAGQRTIYRLAQGNDHRGATWFDQGESVVWLCAYRLHRSGAPDDAFPYFHGLIESKRIWPVEEDYVWLQQDRAARFAERLPAEAGALLARARGAPEVEQRGLIGGGAVGLLVELYETLEETYVAFEVKSLEEDYQRLVLVLAALYPDRSFEEWQPREAMPARALDQGELCLSILRD